MKVLVTGGMGYIGSHTCVQMIEADMEPIIVDNLCNAKIEVLSRIEALTGKQPTFYQGDIRDEVFLDSLFAKHDIQAVIHFAGLKNKPHKILAQKTVRPRHFRLQLQCGQHFAHAQWHAAKRVENQHWAES